ncbi:WAT1-related protein At5g40230-like isoform X1 [Coffea arabica]|uniref:WAT1-related protein n=1 Tax=Coffea arabica TaxID=13443 RepID=A0A6P6T8Q2_COFAR|nr:WAT1-related protein At5g40230-like isoform X1 [Coffea arabica]
MGNWRERGCYTEVIPFTAMITVECINVGLSTIFKAATLKGLNFHVFMLYTYGIAAILLLPFCFFFHRKSDLPPLSFGILARFFSLGILGFVSQYLGYVGIEYSTPTLASAMTNLTPASTFVLAVLLRMEKLEMKSLSTQVKIIGTLVTIAGALLVVLYQGPVLIRSPTASASVSEQQPAIAMITAGAEQSDWVKGGALLAAQYVMVSLWYIFQAKAVARYPAELVVVFFYNLSCMIIAAPVCLIEVSNSSAWNIFKPDVRLYSVLYGGLMGSCFGVLVHTWGLHIKGPVYVALFKPLSIAIAAVMGFIFLGDDLYLGCLIGSLIISFGFYVLMWAKAQEVNGQTSQKRAEFVESCTENAPLLEAYHGSTGEEFQTATV